MPQSTLTSWDIDKSSFNHSVPYHSHVLLPSLWPLNLSDGYVFKSPSCTGQPDVIHAHTGAIPCRCYIFRCTGGCCSPSSYEVPVNPIAAPLQTNFAGFRQHGDHNQQFGLTNAFSPSMTSQNNISSLDCFDISTNLNAASSGTNSFSFLDRGSPTQPSPHSDDNFVGGPEGHGQPQLAENVYHATDQWNIDPALLRMGHAGETFFEDQAFMGFTNGTSPPRCLPSSPSDQTISQYSASGESSEDDFLAPQPKAMSRSSSSSSETHPCPFCRNFTGDAKALRLVQQQYMQIYRL